MNRVPRLIVNLILIAIFTIALTACSPNTPSLGLAPSKPLVEKAIALQVRQTQQQLTQQLQSFPPKFDITQVRLKQLQPLFLGGLPTYRVRGYYNLTFKLQNQPVTQTKNNFDVFLQRQKEGKTWRLLIPEDISNTLPTRWRTYRI